MQHVVRHRTSFQTRTVLHNLPRGRGDGHDTTITTANANSRKDPYSSKGGRGFRKAVLMMFAGSQAGDGAMEPKLCSENCLLHNMTR